MARLRKDELLVLISEFEEINDKIEKSQEIDIDLLMYCQSQALDLGSYIEYEYKNDNITDLIRLLEEYCEYIYQLSQSPNTTLKRKIVKRIRKLLIVLTNHIRNDLPADRKVLVFLPYKASMWDSLESIFLEKQKDKNYELYVIPIPYFDKNADGSMGEMHYEGMQFPLNIPITSWQDISLKKLYPDEIYIHNPYDDGNLVTSIHPAFYARELVNYTRKLIYVPYFVLQEIDPNDQAAVDKIKHFITTAGVYYADQIIVQSENMKQIYVNEYIKWAVEQRFGGKHIDRKYQERRILGLGSPKIDKILKMSKEQIEIPQEWLKVLVKSDGTRKKVVLYNTSIGSLLKYNEKILDKIKNVLKIFYENKNEITLLWRPHPLLKSTIQSMRPALWAEYEQIVSWYKNGAWGIFDDTTDLDRAIMICDAYYGDVSSVVNLVQKTNKIIMIQSVE